MPLYDYHCDKCDQTFEVRQKFSDELLKVHEDCGGQLERLISAPALHFKGSGFYITDYAKGGSGGAIVPPGKDSKHKSESNSDSKSESKSDSKSESKSDSKSESKPESKSESKSETKTESKPAPSKDT
jgi:putative FmdB family regulatory protein